VDYHKHIIVHDQSFEINENDKIATGLLSSLFTSVLHTNF